MSDKPRLERKDYSPKLDKMLNLLEQCVEHLAHLDELLTKVNTPPSFAPEPGVPAWDPPKNPSHIVDR